MARGIMTGMTMYTSVQIGARLIMVATIMQAPITVIKTSSMRAAHIKATGIAPALKAHLEADLVAGLILRVAEASPKECSLEQTIRI
ncbi:hypothetical protein SMD22_12980 [Brevibacillus halotolerans]|uniref:hypothetical protein n=1 Tax=Brevibacillus laterosporus TaxID=1465 RepID=UPI00215C099F|nr:hypothetical protein [Brevibacillus laterosporus]MCR8997374.1 hypothetical protein [Brevibacillus laterosporus]WPS89801.1 hypothetical protein SMD22_12980 [Brevibacillus halotolerans]